MARTALTVTSLPVAGLSDPTPTNIDVTNGMYVDMTSSAIPAGVSSWDLVLVWVNSFAGSKSIIIRAGTSNPPAFRKDKGDLTLANAGSSKISYVSSLEPARFMQSDGKINIDFTASATGTILALLRPHVS